MWPNPQETVDLVIFAEEIFNGKLQFLSSAGSGLASERFSELAIVNFAKQCIFQNVSTTSTALKTNAEIYNTL